MDEFLEVFGGMRLGTVVLLIAAFIFMWKTYKKVEAYFKDKYEMEAEKEKQMKDILGQVQQYPKWREQSIERQKEFSSEINDLLIKSSYKIFAIFAILLKIAAFSPILVSV